MEHLASNIKNIKDFLCRMGKYIRGKLIDNTNYNDIKDLEGIGNVVWEFLSSIYDSHWDSLYVDNFNTTFRSKVSSKFTSQVLKTLNNNKEKEVVKPTFVSPISPPIPAKLQKEVNKLSKYFKKNTNTQQKKSYVHATSSSKQSNSSASKNITRETLKIKKMFPNLPNKKIEEMQKVINSSKDKSKPKINMTTKGPSKKQVIVPMNTNLTKKFIKDSSLYVININCALKDTRKVINQWFNIRSFIAIVRGANMSPGILQCKNCWKWGHMAGVFCIQESKYIRCNGPHLTEYYHHFAWCCKANNKINLPRLETKKGKPCSHSFKYLNCKGKHQANSYDCPFWKHWFNKK